TAAPVEALVEAALNETDPNVAGALRWALAQAGDTGPALLADGLTAARPEVRRRAVRALAEIPGDAATGLLMAALTNDDIVVRQQAALALGPRGVAETVPTLIGMVVDAVNDVEAADALGVLAADPAPAERIATGLAARLSPGPSGAAARRRVAQSLADIPGDTATRVLQSLTDDEDRGVALTAAYVLTLRAAVNP
ncbi:HEAT repeat domain-containing protein, partial [Actinoplanes philippinensis]|uniref:HEAT repeat domain-containing protein n=1 Tax=Actinoplanes philippinensis TaxID=35752 RepID=UPI00340575E4